MHQFQVKPKFVLCLYGVALDFSQSTKGTSPGPLFSKVKPNLDLKPKPKQGILKLLGNYSRS